MVGNCGSCRFWKVSLETGAQLKRNTNGKLMRLGTCKRYPPVIIPQMKSISCPATEFSDWCGEYSPNVSS